MINIVVYHKNCNDGSAAAAVALTELRDCSLPTASIECQYNSSADFDKLYDVLKKNEVNRMFIVDFSFPTNMLNGMAAECEQIFVLDHHASAIERINLETLAPNVQCILDQSRSGVMLAYDFFKGKRTRQEQKPSNIDDYPEFVKLIGVRDLWLNNWMTEYPNARSLHASLLYNDVQEFVNAYTDMYCLARHINNGEVAVQTLDNIREASNKNVRELTWFLNEPDGNYEMIKVQLNFVPYAVVSEQAEFEKDNYDCIITANLVDLDTVKLSLRSRHDTAKRVALALNPKGGGHASAAGCELSLELFSRLTDQMNLFIQKEDSETI